MTSPVLRRQTPVCYAKQIINAIMSIRQQKQVSNVEGISSYLQQYSTITLDSIKQHLKTAISDGFIVEYTAIAFKGHHKGLKQKGYKITHPVKAELEDTGHDWYCFKCHGPGDVYECSDCFRVYHPACTREDTTSEVFTCSVCKASRHKSRMTTTMLNTLLNYTIVYLKEKTKELHKIGDMLSGGDFSRFVYRNMDLNQMEQKILARHYRCTEEFYGDAQTILHNCILVFGEEKSVLTDLALSMVRDCKFNLNEMKLCPDCYYMSNAKPEDWFSQPCNPPHELVYAKQKGCCYWPAKVLQDLDGKYDVRFFGHLHQRAMIQPDCIQPISTDIQTLTAKKMVIKTAGFQKAMTELKRYQEVLEERNSNATKNENVKSEDDNNSKRDEELLEDEEEKAYVNEETADETILGNISQEICKSWATPLAKRKHGSEHEITDRQLISTSVDMLENKCKRKLSKATQSISTSIGIQTQTDFPATEASTRFPTLARVFESAQSLSDRMWEDKVAVSVTSHTAALEKKFEEIKKSALKELSTQLELDFRKDKQQTVEQTLSNLKLELENARKAGENRTKEQYIEEMNKLEIQHKQTISAIKKKQWCRFCQEEAVYHCCWNTNYCSAKCLKDHWWNEHKHTCERKRTQSF